MSPRVSDEVVGCLNILCLVRDIKRGGENTNDNSKGRNITIPNGYFTGCSLKDQPDIAKLP